MTEDVSSMTRLSVTICLLAALVTTVLTLFITGTYLLEGYANQFTNVSLTADAGTVRSMNGKTINGASLYKFIEARRSAISDFTIHQKDGTNLTDTNELLKLGANYYKVVINQQKDKGYVIIATQVDRR